MNKILLGFSFGVFIGLLLGGMFWQPKYLQSQKNYRGAIELVEYYKVAREQQNEN